ncbi:IQ domain-containing protein K-like [Watersipora subatra]|uniref:IQ domain-containing protein K-like n=1 Tax=Watersipora subatra TaxID=2589382 RepID=UPI00355C21B3
MSIITTVPEPNLWEEICKEFQSMRPPFTDELKKDVDALNYDPSKHHPVFYGKMHQRIESIDTDVEFDPSLSHPACIGHVFVDPVPPSPPKSSPQLPDRKKCSPREYLEHYVFPHLLPALEAMLVSAKQERCFERKRTKFNALDFITEYLYKNNAKMNSGDRTGITLFDIPFVQEHLKHHPRPPLPLSLIWTEEEATLVIQSHWRGFLVRRRSDIQELRHWQKDWRRENENIRNKVDDFWADKMDDQTLNEDGGKD